MKHKFGQQLIWTVFFFLIRPFARLLMGFECKPAERIHGPALIMGNHTLDTDMGVLGLSYAQSMRVVASEHIFRMGFLTMLIRLVFSPIVRIKGKTEIRTVREILKTIKNGGRVCMLPEGNRSYNGLTGEIAQASASLARMAKCQLITYRMEGGYFKHPRWAKNGRRGRVYGHEVGRYTPEQLAEMSTEEVLTVIKRDLHEDAYARQRQNPIPYPGKNLAESIETALYLCPKCGGVSTIQSENDRFFCPCGLAMRYTETGMLESTNDEQAVFTTVTGWDLWQQGLTDELVKRADSGIIAKDAEISLYQVTPCKGQKLIQTGTLSIRKDMLMCGSSVFPLDEISDLAIVGINTLVFETTSGGYYEMRSKSAYSALMYRRIFLHCKNILKGECDAPLSVAQP